MESTPVLASLSGVPGSLAAALREVPDPRRAASVVYPLSAILALAVAALLANHQSVLAIAEWGARQDAARLTTLGFADGRTPGQSTLHRLFRQLDSEALSARLLALRWGHWSSENRLPRHKDVNFGEDASLIHAGAGPTVMALLRDAALNLLHHAGIRRVASGLRRHSQHPERAVALVLGPLPTGA
jgi:hypothetical protein